MNRLLLSGLLLAFAAPSFAFSQLRTPDSKADKKDKEKEEKGKKPFNPPRLRGHSTMDSTAEAAPGATTTDAPKVTQASITKDGKLDPGTGKKSDQQDVNALIKKAADKAGGVVAGPTASASPEVKKKDGPRLRGR